MEPDLAVIDVEFYFAQARFADHTVALLSRPADVIALIKPQFEVTTFGPEKGVVRDRNRPYAGLCRHRRFSYRIRSATSSRSFPRLFWAAMETASFSSRRVALKAQFYDDIRLYVAAHDSPDRLRIF